MKKRDLFFFAVITVFSIIYSGCNTSVNNSITFKNLATGDIIVNFRGQDVSVAAGSTGEVKEIPEGTYLYATTFSIPAGATSSTTTGDVSGQVVIKAGTKILILYSSTLINGVYTLSATISNSDSKKISVTGP